MIITETHIQEGGYGNIHVRRMTKVGTCCRKAGHMTGGAAIYVHEAIPCYNEYNMTVKRQHEMERCAVGSVQAAGKGPPVK